METSSAELWWVCDVCLWLCPQANEVLDLAAVQNGGKAVGCSNMHFGHPRNLINPGRWYLRPRTPELKAQCLEIEGGVPCRGSLLSGAFGGGVAAA